MTLTIIAIIYAIGYYLSYCMLCTEHAAEGKPYTYGDRLANLALSIGSFLMVIIALVITWVKFIERTGHWQKPIKPVPEKKEDAKK